MAIDDMEHANGKPNGGTDGPKEESIGPLRRSAFRALVQDFSPLWYEMNRFTH